MGAHSLPRPSHTDAGRIAGVGVLAALSLAGGAGVASAHGTDPGHDDGDGHRGQTVSRADDDATRTTAADPGGICAVLGDVDVPGLDCASDGASSLGHSDRSASTPDDADSGSSAPDADAQPRGVLAPQPSTDGSQGAASAGSPPATPTTQNAGSTQSSGQSAASPAQAQPKTTGNPVDAPAQPGTKRTLPIGG